MLRKLTLSVALASTALVSLSSVTLAASRPLPSRPAPISTGCGAVTSWQLASVVPICTTR